MEAIHPISEIAEQIGHLTNRFEPGTPFYDQVVAQTRDQVAQANTRDDVHALINALEQKLKEHSTDEEMALFLTAVNDLRAIRSAWPVEAFRDGYQKGTGVQLRDDDHAAGRGLSKDPTRT